MKRRRKVPDHRCHGVPVLRDVCPGNVAVAVRAEDGSLYSVFDFPASIVAKVEFIAKHEQQTFDATLTWAIRTGIKKRDDG